MLHPYDTWIELPARTPSTVCSTMSINFIGFPGHGEPVTTRKDYPPIANPTIAKKKPIKDLRLLKKAAIAAAEAAIRDAEQTCYQCIIPENILFADTQNEIPIPRCIAGPKCRRYPYHDNHGTNAGEWDGPDLATLEDGSYSQTTASEHPQPNQEPESCQQGTGNSYTFVPDADLAELLQTLPIPEDTDYQTYVQGMDWNAFPGPGIGALEDPQPEVPLQAAASQESAVAITCEQCSFPIWRIFQQIETGPALPVCRGLDTCRIFQGQHNIDWPAFFECCLLRSPDETEGRKESVQSEDPEGANRGTDGAVSGSDLAGAQQLQQAVEIKRQELCSLETEAKALEEELRRHGLTPEDISRIAKGDFSGLTTDSKETSKKQTGKPLPSSRSACKELIASPPIASPGTTSYVLKSPSSGTSLSAGASAPKELTSKSGTYMTKVSGGPPAPRPRTRPTTLNIRPLTPPSPTVIPKPPSPPPESVAQKREAPSLDSSTASSTKPPPRRRKPPRLDGFSRGRQ